MLLQTTNTAPPDLIARAIEEQNMDSNFFARLLNGTLLCFVHKSKTIPSVLWWTVTPFPLMQIPLLRGVTEAKCFRWGSWQQKKTVQMDTAMVGRSDCQDNQTA